MTPRSLFAVVLALIGTWYLVSFAAMLLSMVTGPFGSLLVGLVVLYIAANVYRGGSRSGE
jgi:hypothetical protein